MIPKYTTYFPGPTIKYSPGAYDGSTKKFPARRCSQAFAYRLLPHAACLKKSPRCVLVSNRMPYIADSANGTTQISALLSSFVIHAPLLHDTNCRRPLPCRETETHMFAMIV